MYSNYFVSLALSTLKCNQKELADKLGVSSTQISKWKKDEHMSEDMEKKFREITGSGLLSPRLVLWAGSVESAKKWERLIHALAENAKENAETCCNTLPLDDEEGFLCDETLSVLDAIGLPAPGCFPDELNIDHYDSEDDGYERFQEAVSGNIHSLIIDQIYHSLNDVYGFYIAYVEELMQDDALNIYDTDAVNIDSELLALAACKIDIDPAIAPRFIQFRYEMEKDYEKWLTELKLRAFRVGIPLKTELLQMVYDSADALGVEAEAEHIGLNKNRLHPDIYMNELLTGMRIIHQILPKILENLDITDFKLDESELRVGK